MKTAFFILVGMSLLALTLISCSKETPKAEDPMLVNDTLSVVSQNIADTTSVGGFSLTEYDTPPSLVQNPLPVYPAKYRDSGIQGAVVLDVEVLSDGQVGDIKVMKSLIPGQGGLDEAAITAVRTWLFKPALLNNKPVNSRVNIPVAFSLKS